MEKRDLWIYRIVTFLFTGLIGMGVVLYFVQHDEISIAFTLLGFPTFIIYPLAIAKILGLTAIWIDKSTQLREWAYAGFTCNLSLAVAAHLNVNDGEFGGAAVALLLLATSYIFHRRISSKKA